MKILILSAAIMLVLFTGAYGRELFLPLEQNAADISSTTIGGPWSAPSTWVGGVVPAAGDNVTITGGATVIIDTAASANSVIVGGTGSIARIKSIFSEGSTPAALRFGETGAFSLTVTGDVTIGSSDSFTTGGGNANQHVLTIGGNLTNDGIFDLSTNNGLAAAMLVFNGNSDSTFGGPGPVNDISWLTIEKGASNTLELTAANFSVRGSTTDTPDSGYLFLNHGIFKISGTFTCANRTFYNNAYEIAQETGFWLNNPNYIVMAQHQAEVSVYGFLRVTAGTYNIGTDFNDSFVFQPGATAIVEGGNINVAGRYMENVDPLSDFDLFYSQTGGTVTTCIVGQISSYYCYDINLYRGFVELTGGNIVIQNGTDGGGAFRYSATSRLRRSDAVVQFGNEFSNTVGPFRVSLGDYLPHVIVSEGMTALLQFNETRNIEVRPGARLRYAGLQFWGDTFVNNGTIENVGGNSNTYFFGGQQVFSGSGTISGPPGAIVLMNEGLTLNQNNNLRVREIEFSRGRLINSGKLTLGNNDNIISRVTIGASESYLQAGAFDSPPVFDLGTGGQHIYYSDGTVGGVPMITGFEINPTRIVEKFSYAANPPSSNKKLTITGGDLTIEDSWEITVATIFTGPNKIIDRSSSFLRQTGYVDGTVARPFSGPGTYTFPVGQNGYSPVFAQVNSVFVPPALIWVTAFDSTLPGLLPNASVSRYWNVNHHSGITAKLTFTYLDADIRGSETDYKLWRSIPGQPIVESGGVLTAANNTFETPVSNSFWGNWGIGKQLDPGPVSISGSVKTAGGQPISGATLTISGGNLTNPITIQTGSFSTYQFSNLQAGETYTIRVDVKRYRFSPNSQQVTPFGNVSNVNFVANPQE